jgi:hypothetical protein
MSKEGGGNQSRACSSQNLLHLQSNVCLHTVMLNESILILPLFQTFLAHLEVAKPTGNNAQLFGLEGQIPDVQCPYGPRRSTKCS